MIEIYATDTESVIYLEEKMTYERKETSLEPVDFDTADDEACERWALERLGITPEELDETIAGGMMKRRDAFQVWRKPGKLALTVYRPQDVFIYEND